MTIGKYSSTTHFFFFTNPLAFVRKTNDDPIFQSLLHYQWRNKRGKAIFHARRRLKNRYAILATINQHKFTLVSLPFDLSFLVTIFRPGNVKSRIGEIPYLVLSGLSIVFMNHHKELRRNFLSVFWRPSYVHE